MAKITQEIVIKNPQGLHARPAAMFVQIVSKYDVEVTIEKDGEEVNGKSIMGILTLGAQKDSRIVISAEGQDSEGVMAELRSLLEKETEE